MREAEIREEKEGNVLESVMNTSSEKVGLGLVMPNEIHKFLAKMYALKYGKGFLWLSRFFK